MNHSYCFDPVVPSLAIEGRTERYPVRRIYCVGRNYAEHAREMGHDPGREAPFFFQKAFDSLVTDTVLPYPSATESLHHEIEMVVALGSGGRDIPADEALQHVFGYAVGLDMTRRDLQARAKAQGRPWSAAKAFDHAAPCSPIVPVDRSGHPSEGDIGLRINGEVRQRGDLSDLIWSVPEVIASLSTLFELKAGDLIFTGTPSGVGEVARGDRLEGWVHGVGSLMLTVG